MVTLLKDYEQQTYFLNTADIGDIVFRNGDQVFLMDQDRLLIYDEDATNWYPVPTGGGGGFTPADEGKVVYNGQLVAQHSDTATQNGTVDTTLINSLTVAVTVPHAIIGESIAADQSMVIPKADGYNNFYAYPKDGDAAYFDIIGRALCCYRLSWMGTSVYSMKASNTNLPPTIVTGTVQPGTSITETASSISVRFPNTNTVGGLPNGTTIAYILW